MDKDTAIYSEEMGQPIFLVLSWKELERREYEWMINQELIKRRITCMCVCMYENT